MLKEHGYDGSAHRARKFARSWFDDYDLLVAMDRMNVKALQQYARKPEDLDKIELLRAYDREATKRGELDVPDPYGASHALFSSVFDVIESGCRALFEHVRDTIET